MQLGARSGKMGKLFVCYTLMKMFLIGCVCWLAPVGESASTPDR